jgi:Protein of unknown function (DUF4242)
MWVAATDPLILSEFLGSCCSSSRDEGATMPLYMDVHTIDGGVAVDDVAKAHEADLQTQGKYDVRYLRYWVDEKQGKVFCLVEAPSAEAASIVHREAHGLVADDVFQVQEGT